MEAQLVSEGSYPLTFVDREGRMSRTPFSPTHFHVPSFLRQDQLRYCWASGLSREIR